MVESVIQIKSGITITVDATVKIKKKIRVQENNYIWNPVTCSCKNDKYLASIIDDSMITCNEVIGETKSKKHCSKFY